MRPSGREPTQMRAVTIERGVSQKAEGSCLVQFGNTKVLVTASVETSLPGWLRGKGQALRDSVAAVSCGIYRGTPVLDLDYLEDVEAHTDANFVLTGSGKYVEIQGTAEQVPFSRDELNNLMTLAEQGIGELTLLQQTALSQ